MFTFRRSYLILLFLLVLLTTTAHANGINPPRPSGSETIEALCTDRKSGNTTTVQRARMTVDEPTGGLEVRLEKSDAQTLRLSRITRVQLATGKPNSDGFAEASLELLEPSYRGEGFVKLRVNGKPVRLAGFSADLRRVDIPLESCRELVLKTSRPSEAEHRAPKMKR